MLAAELVPVRTKLECEERNITMKPRRWHHDPTLRRDVPQYTGTLYASGFATDRKHACAILNGLTRLLPSLNHLKFSPFLVFT